MTADARITGHPPKRYRDGTEALKWDEDASIEDLHEWGCPVFRSGGRHNTEVFIMAGITRMLVRPGNWIVKHADGSFVLVDDETFQQSYATHDAPEEEDPYPGLQRAAFERVGFRRQVGDKWEWRFDGLTKAEVRDGGWEPLYTLRVPTTD